MHCLYYGRIGLHCIHIHIHRHVIGYNLVYQAVMSLQASHAPVVASDFLPKYPLLV